MADVLSSETSIRAYYETSYRIAHHPEAGRATCAEYRTQINNLNRSVQFPWWCERFDNPARGLPLGRLYAEFQSWLRNCGEPPSAKPIAGHWPVLTLGDFSDALVVGAMHLLVECDRELTTANKLRLHVNAVWNAAAERGLVPNRPANKNYRVNLAEPVALLPDEFERIIAAASRRTGMIGGVPAGVWWPAALKFVFSLGVRITAAFGIPTRNLDLVRGDVLVPAWAQKQRREQRLDLFPSVTAALRELRLLERRIATVLGDWPHTINTLRDHYKEIIVAAEIGYDSTEAVPSSLLFHCLRRTLASMLYERHGIQVVCDRLGHSSTDVSARYIDPRYNGQPRIRDLLADPFATPPEERPPLRIAEVG